MGAAVLAIFVLVPFPFPLIFLSIFNPLVTWSNASC